MLVEEKLLEIIKESQQALNHWREGNKRLVVGKADEIEELANAVKWIAINEIKDEEGYF